MSIRYLSTRGAEAKSSAFAIRRGLAQDGGLYVPERFPALDLSDISALIPLTYPERAARILSLLLDDFDPAFLSSACEAAYARFEGGRVAPLSPLGENTWTMELYHGPTLAFKDVALTLLPSLLRESARMTGETNEILILAATSGDTGKAALSGFMDAPGTECAVFYPLGGVSEAQRLQMVTQRGKNVHVIGVHGNFDDAQRGVKRIFAEESARFRDMGYALSSANSINFGRLAPQIAYYFSAYCDLAASGQLRVGEKLDFCVPTGNFGNILAARYAERMGLPVGRLICASNANRVLTDFIETGEYDARRALLLTDSPSMDILVSSNLERLLYELAGRDPETVRGWMASLAKDGRYRLSEGAFSALKALMSGFCCGDAAGREEIARAWNEHGALIDPHTAVGVRALRAYREKTGSARPCVVASTASPFKFGRAVAAALAPEAEGDDFALSSAVSALTGVPVPESIRELTNLPVLHTLSCEKDDMLGALTCALRK